MKAFRNLAACAMIVVAMSRPSDGVTLYNVTFSSPEHTIGAPPAIGGPTAPSEIVFGQPTVEASLGALANQPLVMRDPQGILGPYDQIRFILGQAVSGYAISFDLLVNDPSGGLVIILDTPVVQNLSFGPDQVIRTLQPQQSPPPISNVLGTYSTDTVLRVLIDVDLLTPQWTIAVNGDVLLTGPFYSSSGDIEYVRFSTGDIRQASNGVFGLDNIMIAAVPEPGTPLSVAAGLGILMLLRRIGLALPKLETL